MGLTLELVSSLTLNCLVLFPKLLDFAVETTNCIILRYVVSICDGS